MLSEEEWGAQGGTFLRGPEGDSVYAHEPNETKHSLGGLGLHKVFRL